MIAAGIVLAVIIIIAILRVGADAVYDSNGLVLKAFAGLVSIRLLPERTLSAEEQQNPCSAYELGYKCCYGCALHSHPKDKDENRVQDYVDHGTYHDGQHSGMSIALGIDVWVQAGRQHGKNGSDQINMQVRQGVGKIAVRGSEETQERCGRWRGS